MRFKGNIIITDPCYICKEKEEVGVYPKVEDYISYDSEKDYPDYKKEFVWIKTMPGRVEKIWCRTSRISK